MNWLDVSPSAPHSDRPFKCRAKLSPPPSPNILQTAEAEKIFSEIYLFKKSNDKLGNGLILFRHSESTDSSSTAEW